MNRTKTRLALLVASVCLCTSVWAERVAPTFPSEFVEPESGGTYYIYNVGTEKFINTSDVNYYYKPKATLDTYGSPIDVTFLEDGTCTFALTGIIYNSSSLYLKSSTQAVYYYNGASRYMYFRMTESDGGYTIQGTGVNQSTDGYWGYPTESTNSQISSAVTTGDNIVWKFMAKDVAEYYFAKLKLYTALETMDDYRYNVDKYEAVYTDPASTTEQLDAAAALLTASLTLTNNITAPEWSDYPVLLEPIGEVAWGIGNNVLYSPGRSGNPNVWSEFEMALRATVATDQEATFVYTLSSVGSFVYDVYLDGELIRSVPKSTTGRVPNDYRFCMELMPGIHEVEWQVKKTSAEDEVTLSLSEIGVEKTPSIEVSLLEPGSLGTEVLYHVDHVKDVRRLKIKGTMNSDDWAKIDMMTNLFSLDLSETEITSIADNQFNVDMGKCEFLHRVVLPEGLSSIGSRAFYRSNIEAVDFPSTLQAIGESAFESTAISDIEFTDNIHTIGGSAFYNCQLVQEVVYPKDMVSVPQSCFGGCIRLRDVILQEGLKEIQTSAFNATMVNPRFPETLESVGRYAFSGVPMDSLILPESVTNIGDYAFQNTPIVYAEFPTSYSNAGWEIHDCSNLKTLVLKSPTPVGGSYKSSFLDGCPSDIVVRVPSFAVNSYKLDEYWYNYTIEGFDASEIKEWTLSSNLILNARERMGECPDLTISQTGSIKINGDAAQRFNSLHTRSYNYYSGTGSDNFARIMVNNNSTNIVGEHKHQYYMNAQRWHFVCLPFDFNVGDVTSDVENAKYVFRYYDGAARAENGATGNWKNYAPDATIAAGTGFIVQTNVACWLQFTALDNENKQNVVSNEMFVKSLEAYASEETSNRGWNLVGNPWQCWYNIHALNFTAPITTYDLYSNKYNAYSIIDDDYAIEPNEAFFVQCPEGGTSISFPETGRQITSEIVNQQSARPRKAGIAAERQLIDIVLSDGEQSDRTRIVFNDEASMDYEINCDASKFLAVESSAPQLYTIGADNIDYAINERPYDAGYVRLGVVLANQGTYSFSLRRNDSREVLLVDETSGVTHNFIDGDYTFTAKAGTYANRFSIRSIKSTTDIDVSTNNVSIVAVEGGIQVNVANGDVEIFAADGRLVTIVTTDAFVPLMKGTYVVRTIGGTMKVIVQ